MTQIKRRTFAGTLMAASQLPAAGTRMDETLRKGIELRKIPCAVGAVANGKATIYEGAFGTRESTSGVAVDLTPFLQLLP